MKWFRFWFDKDRDFQGFNMGHYFIRAENEKSAIERISEIERDLGKINKMVQITNDQLSEWRFNGAYKLY